MSLPRSYICAVCDEWIVDAEPHTDPETGEDVCPWHCSDCGYVPVHPGQVVFDFAKPHPDPDALRLAQTPRRSA